MTLFATAVALSTLGVCRKSGERMPPRRQLRRLWLTLRFMFFAVAAIVMAMFFSPLSYQGTITPASVTELDQLL